MTTALITHPDCTGHVNPDGHPEQVARLAAVLDALEGLDLLRVTAPLAADDDVLRVHPQSHLDALRAAVPDQGQAPLDADTWVSPGSMAAAHRSAGGVLRAVDMVLGGEAGNAFAAGRPPGHHAEREKPMGFCLFGNVAMAAKYALDHHGLERVAIVDFDVHHGNGTQDLCEDDPRILFVSSHQMPLYPGTGDPSETGVDNNVLNIALADGSDGAVMRDIYTREVFPAIRAHRPDLILVSAGFDAHADDPLAGLRWHERDFTWLTGQLCDLAEDLCGGKLVSALEGGYDLAALGRCARAHVEVLIGRGK
ncbi:MAG: acetoin utilization protein [Rhodobacterales bacterium]|nr:MAG: acetoin utilization protein [Rhodobacterales bacterium]